MANIKVQYNGSTANYTAPLDTAGKLMVSDLTITAESVLQDKSVTSNGSITADSGYDGLGTVTVAVPSDLNNTDLDVTQTSQIQNYQAPVGFSGIGSITVTAQAANPAFDGGALSVSGSAAATGTNASLSGTNTSGISVKATANATPARDSVIYAEAVNGWVNKAYNTTALTGESGTSTALTSTTYYINNLTVPSGKTLTVTTLTGRMNVSDGTGSLYRTGTSGVNYINGTATGNRVVYTDKKGVSVDGVTVTDTNWDLITQALPSPTISQSGNVVTAQVNLSNSGWVTNGTTSATFEVSGGTPTFTNIGTTTSNVSGAYVTSGSDNYYVSSITVPSAKTLTIANTGTTNINGGNANRGVRVAGKVATVDTYVVTDANGDLLTPTYTASTKALSYPTTWTTSGSTATYPTLTGDVETINGLTIKDSTALRGSGTAPTDATYGYYLAKWTSSSALGTGSKVTISTSTPSGGSNGDIWYQVL